MIGETSQRVIERDESKGRERLREGHSWKYLQRKLKSRINERKGSLRSQFPTNIRFAEEYEVLRQIAGATVNRKMLYDPSREH